MNESKRVSNHQRSVRRFVWSARISALLFGSLTVFLLTYLQTTRQIETVNDGRILIYKEIDTLSNYASDITRLSHSYTVNKDEDYRVRFNNTLRELYFFYPKVKLDAEDAKTLENLLEEVKALGRLAKHSLDKTDLNEQNHLLHSREYNDLEERVAGSAQALQDSVETKVSRFLHAQQSIARVAFWLFAVFGLFLCSTAYLAYVSFYRILGGSLTSLYALIKKIGKEGKTEANGGSLLSWLEESFLRLSNSLEETQYYANFDALTGLPNRRQVMEFATTCLALGRRHRQTTAFFFIDLDNFKALNDTYGHAVGDTLLKEKAKRLKSLLREQDMLARLGGDEFYLVLPGTDHSGAINVACKILDSCNIPYEINHLRLYITMSVGIVIAPNDGEAVEELFKHADLAMYDAKRSGPGNHRFFNYLMHKQAQRKAELTQEMRYALEKNEMFLVYQPQYCLRTGALTGVEALLRWMHPDLGLIPPDEFIPLAEESRFILVLGEWVMQEALRRAKGWEKQGLLDNYRAFAVAVNLSPVQFHHADLVQSVRASVESTGLTRCRLELEITESTTASDPLKAATTLQQLSKTGIVVSLDDFGTGYSSLNHLRHFAVYKLKIDKSFLGDTDKDKAVVVSIIDLARSLRLQTIAEGVETQDQVNFLKVSGCDEAQGYYFSRPLLPNDMEALLLKQLPPS